VILAGCAPDEVPIELRPDTVLRAELGLTDLDEVHRVTLSGGPVEQVSPSEVVVPPGAWVEFVSSDWWVHEVRFSSDSLSAEAAAFLSATDQVDSPPMVERDARFVVSFAGAPVGRYPFTVSGNGAAGGGVVVVQLKR
jgi:plastocyanin